MSYTGRVRPPELQLQRDVDALAAAEGVLARLDAIRRLRERAETLEAELVVAARADGASWTAIGGLYGMTKQGAQQRFGPATKARRRRRTEEADAGPDADRRL